MMLAERVMYIPKQFYQRRLLETSIMGTDFDLRKAKDYLMVINAITDLRELNGGKGWSCIKKINKGRLNDLVHVCYGNHLYQKNIGLIRQILKVWIRMAK